MKLLSPKIPTDWKQIINYEASLCYALITRDMIYCQNLVIEDKTDKIKTVIRGHRTSIEKIYQLHPNDEE